MKKTILLFIIFVGLFSHTKAQWTQGSGIDGGDFRCLAKVGNDIYAGSTYGGVFRTSNNGDSWTPLLNGLPGGVSVTRIMNNGPSLFAATSYWSLQGKGVYRSDDNGATWIQKNNGIMINPEPTFTDLNITGLAKNTSYIFASTQANGIYRSNDNGDNWVRVFDQYAPDSSFRQILALCSVGEVIIAGGTYGDAMYRSIDNGVSWTPIITGLPSGFIVYGLTSNGINTYATTSHGFYWSPSNGDYWIGINNGISQPYGAANGAISADGSVIYASTNDGTEGPKTYKSINGGTTFVDIPAMAIYRVSALLAEGDNVFASNLGGIYGYTLTTGGVVRSIDSGATWSSITTGLSGLNCTSLSSDGTDIYAGSRYYSGIYKSSDNGNTWTKSLLPGTTTNYQVLSMMNVGSDIYAGNNTYTTSGGVFRSTDNAQSWSTTGSIGYPVYALGANSSYIFAGTSNQGMRRSSNNGTSWTTINTGLPTVGERSIRAITISGTNIFIGTTRGVFLSNNEGTNWAAANGGSGSPGYTQVRSIAVKGDTLFAATSSGVIRSYNKGINWSIVSSNTDIGSANALYLNGTDLYAGGKGGVYKSSDWGETWTSLNETFPSVSEIYSVLVVNNRLYAGTYGQSLWYIDLEAPVTRTLNVSAVLEGLYKGEGSMNEANGDLGPQFGEGIADEITVELHNALEYETIEQTFNNVQLDIYGNTTITVPTELTGEYYITIKHRNSIVTVSALPVSFAGNTITYAFDAPGKAYGGNLLQMTDGTYVIYGGDVNQDETIDSADMTPVDNDATNFMVGYLATDVNGDGTVDSGDMTIVDNNASGFISAVTP